MAVKINPFRYKISRPVARPDVLAIRPAIEQEEFVGQIQGMPASDIEERFARALGKVQRVMGYEFRAAYAAGRNMPGEIEVDFMVNTGVITPVFIDGEFSHRHEAQRQEDMLKTAILDDLLRGAAQPSVRVSFERLGTQEQADQTAREMFG